MKVLEKSLNFTFTKGWTLDTLIKTKTDHSFLSFQRVAMFNAYATSFICRKGFEILDVHPLTASYPDGTGGPKMEYFKEHDIVHYKTNVARPFEDVLAEYLLGNLPEKLTFENYRFS